MDPAAVDRLAGERVAHGSSDEADVLDFSANCNPEVPDCVTSIYADALDDAGSYPDDTYPAFRAAAADFTGVEPEQIVPTPGGLAAIRLAIEVTLDADGRALVPTPSFGEYAREVKLQGATVERVPYHSVLDRDPESFDLVVVCNPNNPTGDAYDPDRLRAFAARCHSAGTVLLADEAFLGFTDQSSLAGTDGVIVARSLTKLFGLPGLRMGFAVATGSLREGLLSARRTWNLGVPAARVGAVCLADDGFVTETSQRVRAERDRLTTRLDGPFSVIEPADGMVAASAPFVLVACGSNERVEVILTTARKHGIELRDAQTFTGLDRHVRVAVRRPAENDRLCEVLEDV